MDESWTSHGDARGIKPSSQAASEARALRLDRMKRLSPMAGTPLESGLSPLPTHPRLSSSRGSPLPHLQPRAEGPNAGAYAASHESIQGYFGSVDRAASKQALVEAAQPARDTTPVGAPRFPVDAPRLVLSVPRDE